MRITRQYDITDETLGIKTAEAIDVECDVSLEWDHGHRIVVVNTVEVYGKNLFTGSTLSRMLASEIADMVESDDDVLAELMASEGYMWAGRTPNDPRGRMRATS
jgi:hypothetical protein